MIQEVARRKQRCSSLRNRLHPAGNAGFTLMELVIVLALMVLVIGMVYTFLHFTNNSFVRGGDQFQLQTNIRTASDFVIGEIRNATEIEIVSVPFIVDASSQYIYIENKVLKHRNAGKVTDKSESVFTGSEPFAARKDNTTGRYYAIINLQGTRRDDEYTLNTEILLNNISSITGAVSGNAIRYKK